jgi:hypothetical protein
MHDAFLPTLLAKARTLGGPFVAFALLSAAAGWALRGASEGQVNTTASIARLDSTTVKRDTFALFVQEVRGELRLVRRYVCRQSPDLCP